MDEPSCSDIVLPAVSLSSQRVGGITTIELDGLEYRARIIEVFDGKARLRPFERLSRASESNLSITLIQALAKKERMELIIQKATELGVTAIVPCVTAKSITLADRTKAQDKTHRWSAIASKATEQSRRRVIPRVEECMELAEALKNASDAELKVMLYERETEMDLHGLAGKKIKSMAIASGPEGGFSEEEVALARTFGFVPVRLGGRILRCETASIAAISVAQFVWGDF